MNDNTQEQKDDGKIQPVKLTPEQLEKRRETGYKTDEESRRTPSSTMGKDPEPEEPQKPEAETE